MTGRPCSRRNGGMARATMPTMISTWDASTGRPPPMLAGEKNLSTFSTTGSFGRRCSSAAAMTASISWSLDASISVSRSRRTISPNLCSRSRSQRRATWASTRRNATTLDRSRRALERSRQICCVLARPWFRPQTLAGRSSAARHVVPFQPECRPRDSYDEAYTDGEEHGTKHVLESVPGMLRARCTRAKASRRNAGSGICAIAQPVVAR